MTELPAGYLLPPGWTMADVRRMDKNLANVEMQPAVILGTRATAERLLIAGKFLQEAKDAQGNAGD